MKNFRLIVAAALLSLAAGACSSPTIEYPDPGDDDEEPPPESGLVVSTLVGVESPIEVHTIGH